MPPRRRGESREDAGQLVPRPRAAAEEVSRTGQEVDALRRGDQAAFADLVRRLHPSMVRLATTYVSSPAVAEEVAQDTWVAVIEELDRFEGRSSLKTWIFRILVNHAKTRGVRERRTTPFSSLSPQQDPAGPDMPSDAFFDHEHRWAGHWAVPVPRWDMPEEHLLSVELGRVIHEAVDDLPPAQRAVVSLRDVQSLSSQEVCDLLGLTEVNQRVLLHRGRTAVRAAVAAYAGRVAVAV